MSSKLQDTYNEEGQRTSPALPEEVKNYAESAAYRAAEPVTLAKLSDYGDFIKAQVDASQGGLRQGPGHGTSYVQH